MGVAAVSGTSVGSSAASNRPPEDAHAEHSRKARSGSADDAPPEARAEDRRNTEASGRNDIVVR